MRGWRYLGLPAIRKCGKREMRFSDYLRNLSERLEKNERRRGGE
jgi:hypothetical protein